MAWPDRLRRLAGGRYRPNGWHRALPGSSERSWVRGRLCGSHELAGRRKGNGTVFCGARNYLEGLSPPCDTLCLSISEKTRCQPAPRLAIIASSTGKLFFLALACFGWTYATVGGNGGGQPFGDGCGGRCSVVGLPRVFRTLEATAGTAQAGRTSSASAVPVTASRRVRTTIDSSGIGGGAEPSPIEGRLTRPRGRSSANWMRCPSPRPARGRHGTRCDGWMPPSGCRICFSVIHIPK